MAFVLKFSPTSEGYAEEHIEFTQADRKITFVNRFDSYEVLTDEVDLTDDFFESKELLNYNPKKGIRTNLFHWTSEKEGERVKYRIKGAVDREEKQELIEAFKEIDNKPEFITLLRILIGSYKRYKDEIDLPVTLNRVVELSKEKLMFPIALTDLQVSWA